MKVLITMIGLVTTLASVNAFAFKHRDTAADNQVTIRDTSGTVTNQPIYLFNTTFGGSK